MAKIKTHQKQNLRKAKKHERRQQALEALDKAIEVDPHYKPAKDNRKLIASLKEGECLEVEMQVVNYYKDHFQKKKSCIKKLAEALGFRQS